MRVYVAAPYSHAAIVRGIHGELSQLGIEPTSRWAEEATGPESLEALSPAQLRKAIDQNDADLRASDVLLLHDWSGIGRETYAEVARSLDWRKAVVWAGKASLSAYRPAVVRVETMAAAYVVLAHMRGLLAEGYRGEMLAVLARGSRFDPEVTALLEQIRERS